MMNFNRILRLFFTSALAILFASCVSLPNTSGSYLPPEMETEDSITWKQVAPDVLQFDYKSSKMDYHIVKIDLNAKWHIDSYPRSRQWVKPVSVKTFAKKTEATVAMNTTPFRSQSRFFWSKLKPTGISRHNYINYSEITSKYCALAFFEDENETLRAEIYDSQNELANKNPVHAFGGFYSIYRNGTFNKFKEIKDFRSAAAVSGNGKILYLLAGKNMSFNDCAKIFAALGVQSAMEFDGGSSSQLFVNKKYVLFNFLSRNVAAVFSLSPKISGKK